MRPKSKEMRMAQLRVTLHKAAHNITSDEERAELENMTHLFIMRPYAFEAAEKLQLPLPDLKRISATDVRALVNWKEEKLNDASYNRLNLLEDIAQKYQEMREAELSSSQSTVIYSQDSLESIRDKNLMSETNTRQGAALKDVADLSPSRSFQPLNSPLGKRAAEEQVRGSKLKRSTTIDPSRQVHRS